MRTNHLKEKLRRGELANGVLISWPCPEMVEFFGYLGFDYVFIDAEHGALGRESCAALVLASHAAGITPLVRVPENNPATILGYLETGAHGVVVPHVSTAAEAEAVVQAVRYSPIGRRSGSSATRLTGYGTLGSTKDYFAWANDEILVYVEIEDRTGIENLDEILAVPGIDIVGLGPLDIANDLGFPGERDHPEVRPILDDLRRRIHEATGVRIRTVLETTLLADAGRRFLAAAE